MIFISRPVFRIAHNIEIVLYVQAVSGARVGQTVEVSMTILYLKVFKRSMSGILAGISFRGSIAC